MENAKSYIDDVLQELQQYFTGKVSEHVFTERRPKAHIGQMRDMVILTLATRIMDEHVRQRAVLDIELLCKDKAEGIADGEALRRLTDALYASLPIKTERYSVSRPGSFSLDGADSLGYTGRTMQATLYINTTDRYQI